MSDEDGRLSPEDEIRRAIGDDAYVSMVRPGTCKVCGKTDDLRFGCCFTCADHVKTDALHRLWDERMPENQWYCDDAGNVIDPAGWISAYAAGTSRGS